MIIIRYDIPIYTQILWLSCLQNAMAYLLTRINRMHDALHVTQLLHNNYFINCDLIKDSPYERSISLLRVSPHVSEAHTSG